MATVQKLSARSIEAKRKLGYHADAQQPGLYLQVTKGVSALTKSWVFRYTSPTTGKRREMGLGPTSLRSLADARTLCGQYRKLLLDGVDPIDERENDGLKRKLEIANTITFDEAAERCIAARSPEWRNGKHAQQWVNTLATYASPVLGKLPVNTIDTAQVMRVLEPIWKTKTETATRVRQRIERVVDWAKARGYFSGDNPARLEGNLRELLPRASKTKKVRHHPAVPFIQINPFIQALRQRSGTGARGLEFLIMTAARTTEVTQAQWVEIDLDAKVWTIPAERMKTQKEHRVPLNNRAMEILRTMHNAKEGDYVFKGQRANVDRGLSNAAFLAIMRDMKTYSDFVTHGFRSTFRDWAAERTAYPNETIELALAHAVRNPTEAAYRRGDQLEKRAALMTDWGKYMEHAAEMSSPVTSISGRRKNAPR